MSVLSSKTRSAIRNAIQSGWQLNISLAEQFSGTNQKQREAIIFEAATEVCDTYNAQPKCATVLGFKKSSRGGAPTIGDVATDGSIITAKPGKGGKQAGKLYISAAAEAANRWFQRNIIGAGFITTNPKPSANSKSPVERLAAAYDKLDGKDRAAFRRLIGF